MPPISYKEIILEAARQLNKRKEIIIRRVVYVMWPMPVFVVIFGTVITIVKNNQLSNLQVFFGITIAIIFALYVVIHIFIARTIFSFEKKIWINSYFDNKNLTSDESWTVAKKMFWPALKFRTILFLKYYSFGISSYNLDL